MKQNTNIEFFKFISNLKIRAQKDAENASLSREILVPTYDYYNSLFSDYLPLHKDDHYVAMELEELKLYINKLKSRIEFFSK
ncbi:hypothetical protein [Ilyobacter polytropus]|uniref:Uncharacterized protein n=1 Tax=Ilyobacter polytropus (strain ATCC 51220 / DSM 2926 / LMG 16218 / CuHBu1) TaxID=572544 RepID=E3HBR2_ILYPC|nr:hypothetical protein [Ilyobacter polytropus]ADO83824.1 conserved hypothetical protein [Ilyobacter polytropus DSM 2926]